MKPFCEYMVKEIFPCLRAMVAQDLVGTHGVSQSRAAELMGISQPAVSQYIRSMRGRKKDMLEKGNVKEKIRGMAEALFSKKIGKDGIAAGFCDICAILEEEYNAGKANYS